MVICLELGADLHMAHLMPLPLTVSCFSKIQIGFIFLVPAHPGSPGKGPLNGCVCVCLMVFVFLLGWAWCCSAVGYKAADRDYQSVWYCQWTDTNNQWTWRAGECCISARCVSFGEFDLWSLTPAAMVMSRVLEVAFSSLTLLVGRQEEHLACKNWVMRCWCGCLSGVRYRLFAYDPADASASQNPIISCLI